MNRLVVLLAALLLGSSTLRANPDHGFFQITLGDVADLVSDERDAFMGIEFSSESGFILELSAYDQDGFWSGTNDDCMECTEFSLGWEFRRPMNNSGDYLFGVSYWDLEEEDDWSSDSGFKWHAGFRLASTSNFQLDLKYSGFLATDYSHDNRLDLDVSIGGNGKVVFGWDFQKDFLLLGFRAG